MKSIEWKEIINRTELFYESYDTNICRKNNMLLIWNEEFEEWYNGMCNPWDSKLREFINSANK